MVKLLVALAVAAAVALVLIGVIVSTRGTAAGRARSLQRAGLGLAALFTLVGVPWIAAGALSSGGWAAAIRIASFLVPLVVLSVISWYRVAWAIGLLPALTAAAVAAGIWYAIDPEAWRAFENSNGAIRVVGSFVLVAPIALLGWRRPLLAGVLLLVLGVAPLSLAAIGTFDGLASLVTVSLPAVLIGVLYSIGAAVAGGSGPQCRCGRVGMVRDQERPIAAGGGGDPASARGTAGEPAR
jgi:hypothetical protein